MKAIQMKKMMNCVAVSGALIFAAGQTMAMNQQATRWEAAFCSIE